MIPNTVHLAGCQVHEKEAGHTAPLEAAPEYQF